MSNHSDHTQLDDRGNFPTDIRDLPKSQRSELVSLADGEEFDLRIAPIVKRLGNATVRMLAYNGSVPGPTIRVQQGSEVVINVTNEADTEATVHWHGLRLDNAYDGTHETQTPMQVGRKLQLSTALPRSRPVLVPPAHPRGLRPGDGLVRQHRGRPVGPGLLAPGEPGGTAHPR